MASNGSNRIDNLRDDFKSEFVAPDQPLITSAGDTVGSGAARGTALSYKDAGGVVKRYFIWGRDNFDDPNVIFK